MILNDTLIKAAYWMTTAFTFYTLYRLYTLLFKEMRNKKLCVLTFIVAYFIVSLQWQLYHSVPLTLSVNIVLYFALTFNYKAKIGKRILSTIGAYALFSVAETVVVGIFSIAGLDILHIEFYKLWGTALSPLITYVIISATIQRLAIRELTYFKSRHTAFLGIIIFIIFGTAFVLPYISADNIGHMFIGIVLLMVIAVFLFAFMDSLVQESKERAVRTAFEMQNKLYSNELDMVKEYQYEIKTIRHNIDHHIQTLNDLLSKEDYENARNYAKGLTKVIKVDLIPIITSIPELDSILNLKLKQAYMMGIKVNSTVKVEEKCLISPQAYISIIGNLMDNAMEAVAPFEDEEKRYLDIAVGVVKGTFFIETMNPYLAEPIKEGKAYISTKEDAQEHGIGLAHVRDIVQRSHGSVEIDDHFMDEHIFNIKVLLYNR